MRVLALALGLVIGMVCHVSADERSALLGRAYAYWKLGEMKGDARPLTSSGDIRTDVPATGKGAIPGAKVARLNSGYFSAGKDLHMRGSALTVYLRIHDTTGRWDSGLFSKRGNHDICNFNLFSVDLAGTKGTDIGFEMHTSRGFVMLSFPVSLIDPTAWHDLVGRYDGRTLEIICDGRVMARRPWAGGNLTTNDEPLTIGAEADRGAIYRPFTGEVEEAALWNRALKDAELASLMRKEKIMAYSSGAGKPGASIHFRPLTNRMADTIPFYWKGEYHIFYLLAQTPVPWEHIVSKDLIHWKDLPTALATDGDPQGPDGLHMFTGSVIEKDGLFHIFYTGWNNGNPLGREFIMHATSHDLIHWTKHREDMIAPDGIHYANHKDRDFRDPYVFWNDSENCYWMVYLGNDATTHAMVQGVAVSKDLRKWEQTDHIAGIDGQECPDMFRIGDTWYLIGGGMYHWARNPRGPYQTAVSPVIDVPFIYAGKRMFDGKRHIWTGWLWDRDPDNDTGNMTWGGTQCLPRELYAGPNGQLYCRPAREIPAAFTKTTLDVTDGLVLDASQSPRHTLDVPENYLFECTVELDPKAVFTMTMRQQGNPDTGYRLVLNPETQEAGIASAKFNHPRRIELDASKPIRIQAFVEGTTMECFINDAYAFSCRGYDYSKGKLGLSVSGGKAKVVDLKVKVRGSQPGL